MRLVSLGEDMFSKISGLALALSLSVGATAGSAATHFYQLLDHEDGALTPPHSYGLRLDDADAIVGNRKVFSFENGGASILEYNDMAGTASISGTMVESNSDGTFGGIWDVVYNFTNLFDLGGGFFECREANNGNPACSASGSISMGSTSYELGQKANNQSPGRYFIFNGDGYRLSGDNSTPVGRGWVDPEDNSRFGANDFLFTAAKIPPPPPGMEVPLPAAGWMLIAGVAGLGYMGRRKRKAS